MCRVPRAPRNMITRKVHCIINRAVRQTASPARQPFYIRCMNVMCVAAVFRWFVSKQAALQLLIEHIWAPNRWFGTWGKPSDLECVVPDVWAGHRSACQGDDSEFDRWRAGAATSACGLEEIQKMLCDREPFVTGRATKDFLNLCICGAVVIAGEPVVFWVTASRLGFRTLGNVFLSFTENQVSLQPASFFEIVPRRVIHDPL